MAHLLLVRPNAAAADDPGTIQGFHRAIRYPPNLIYPMSFDGVGFAFMGDVAAGQSPPSIILANHYFNQAGDAIVPTAAYMDELLAADPDAILVGPYPAGTANTELIRVRYITYIPQRYMAMFLGDDMTPRSAWEQLRGAIVAAGDEASCAHLLAWLRVALTRRAPNESGRVAVDVPGVQTLANRREAQAFRSFQTGIIHQDFPELQGGLIGMGAHQISQRIGELAEQARLTREADEQARATATNKKPSSLFTTDITKLLRWCQVESEADLPEVYTLAANAKKSERRRLLETRVNAAMETLGYSSEILISLKLANKFFDLHWASSVADTLELGIHVFSLGFRDDAASELLRRQNERADLLTNNSAAPSISDTVTVLETTEEVQIAQTLGQLRRTVEQSQAFWLVALGAGHQRVETYRSYRQYLVDRETQLDTVKPRNPAWNGKVPALLQRRLQLEENVWAYDQQRSHSPIQMANSLAVFSEISQGSDWVRTMPPDYFAVPHFVDDAGSVMSPMTGATEASTFATLLAQQSAQVASLQQQLSRQHQAGTPGGASDAASASQTQVRIANYNEKFLRFKQMGVRTRSVKERCATENVSWPMIGTRRFCAGYHVIGTCNSRCGSKLDHVPHTAAEDDSVMPWLEANWHN
jgi:hypothetical protein